MTQEQKDLLIKDIYARLPYGIKISYDEGNVVNVVGIHKDSIIIPYAGMTCTIRIDNCKPYLFPFSSMTKEQRIEYDYLHSIIFSCFEDSLCEAIAKLHDWLNKNRFDYRGLIPMGLAVDATGLNIY